MRIYQILGQQTRTKEAFQETIKLKFCKYNSINTIDDDSSNLELGDFG